MPTFCCSNIADETSYKVFIRYAHYETDSSLSKINYVFSLGKEMSYYEKMFSKISGSVYTTLCANRIYGLHFLT